MKANEFFKNEQLPEETNFEKVPEGMTFIKTDTLDIETTEKDFGEGKKIRYKINFKNKKGEDKEYEVGIQVIRGIEEAIQKNTEYIVLTRQGKSREDTKYTVAAMEEWYIMPGNIVTLNNSIEWYVGDSKMEEFLEYMKRVGIKQKKK